MGLLKHLLFWPVTGPLFLTEFSLDKVEGVVREELTDDTRIKAELMELQLQLELGDIDDAAYIEAEAALMAQLRDVRAWREEFGMGVAGGPVRVPTSPPADEAGDASGADAAGSVPAAPAGPESAEAEDRSPRGTDPPAGVEIDLKLDWD